MADRLCPDWKDGPEAFCRRAAEQQYVRQNKSNYMKDLRIQNSVVHKGPFFLFFTCRIKEDDQGNYLFILLSSDYLEAASQAVS